MRSETLIRHDLKISTLLRLFPGRIAITWGMTLYETVLLALIPLFIGYAIDGLLAERLGALVNLGLLFVALVVVAVLRRLYDTRVYSTMRVELGKAQAARGAYLPVSTLNAQIGMGRELVEFLEETLPIVITGAMQLTIAVVILYSYSPLLAASAAIAAAMAMCIYALFHRRFYRLNGDLNQQTEKQVGVLERRRARSVAAHFFGLRRAEVRISDTEALLYGFVFLALLALVIFNIWHATTALAVTTGAIFAIVSYSWDFVDGSVTLPATLQSWTRLSEITRRINGERTAVALSDDAAAK